VDGEAKTDLWNEEWRGSLRNEGWIPDGGGCRDENEIRKRERGAPALLPAPL